MTDIISLVEILICIEKVYCVDCYQRCISYRSVGFKDFQKKIMKIIKYLNLPVRLQEGDIYIYSIIIIILYFS